MRTTVNINDDLLERAKAIANAKHTSLSELVSEGLRLLFFTPKSTDKKPCTKILTFKGNGMNPGIDLDSNASMIDMMEDR